MEHHGRCLVVSGSTRMESALSSRWKLLNRELGKWRDALTKAMNTHASGENLSDEIVQAQMWYCPTGQGKKSFNHTQCWEVVKHCNLALFQRLQRWC
ncbi:unnamed protein product [Prunus armeniaca]